MAFLKDGAGRWAVPSVLAAVLAVALLITPVIAGTKNVSGNKVVKTISKKVNVTQLPIPGPSSLGPGFSPLGTLTLGAGSYDVRTTLDVRQNAPSVNVTCVLRVAGVGQDQSDTFTGSGTLSAQNSVAMEVSGTARAGTTAQLLCLSTGPADVNHGEITALKVPLAKVL
jgi:hypothetical protein